MPRGTIKDPAIEVIRDELTRAVSGHPWHGSSLVDLLEGIPPKLAAARPVAAAHSIWEIVLHLTSWARECARRVRDGVARDPEMGDWPAVGGTGAAAWEKAQRWLADANREVLEALDDLDADRLREIVRDTRSSGSHRPVTLEVLLHGLAQHYAYHGGQIAMLSRALAAAPGTIS